RIGPGVGVRHGHTFHRRPRGSVRRAAASGTGRGLLQGRGRRAAPEGGSRPEPAAIAGGFPPPDGRTGGRADPRPERRAVTGCLGAATALASGRAAVYNEQTPRNNPGVAWPPTDTPDGASSSARSPTPASVKWPAAPASSTATRPTSTRRSA